MVAMGQRAKCALPLFILLFNFFVFNKADFI